MYIFTKPDSTGHIVRVKRHQLSHLIQSDLQYALTHGWMIEYIYGE